MTIKLPERVNLIINRLIENGYDAYAVGGCVRDSILGREPDDWDITTSAKPEQVKAVFAKTIDTGIEHGTVTVMIEKEGFEVTTYRIDGEYEDSRHPKNVEFTNDLVEDLKRRDFTINAMAYNDAKGLVDAFDGIKDLNDGIIRCVGCATDRFTEDALRILRAIRFSAQLGFELEEETQAAIIKLAPNLKNISAERIQVELVKLMLSPNPWFIRKAYETGVTKVILPEFDDMMICEQNNPHHLYTVGEHTLKSLEYIRKDKVLRLAVLLHDIGKPQVKTMGEDGLEHFYNHGMAGSELAKKVFRRLKFDRDTMDKVCHLIKWHDYKVEPDKKAVRRAINKIGEDMFLPLFALKRADVMGQSEYLRQEKLDHFDRIEELYEEIIGENQCVSLKTLAVSGKDLLELGVEPGKMVGEILNSLLDKVIDEPDLNSKDILLDLVKRQVNN